MRARTSATIDAPRLNSLWCIPARGAPVIGVLLSMTVGGARWSHVMRWNIETNRVEHGAWARLRLVPLMCRLSRTGIFMWYKGISKGKPFGAPRRAFQADMGGGYAISRLPWLASLVDIQTGCIFEPLPGNHALSPPEQARLRGLFAQDDSTYDRWWLRQQPGWRVLERSEWPNEHVLPPTRKRKRTVLAIRREGMPFELMCAADRVVQGSANERRAFALRSVDEPDRLGPWMSGVEWAWLDHKGRLFTTSSDGVLRAYHTLRSGDPAVMPRLRRSHDVLSLNPNPGPSPALAQAALQPEELKG